MKKIFLFLIAALMVFTLGACNKTVDRSQYDEGEKLDEEESSNYAEENPGDPYAQSEIGLHRAYKNLIIVMGSYDNDLECYVQYEYIKDAVYNNAPCYIYSKKVSKTADGEFTHNSYIAVYKDGSYITTMETTP